MDLDIAAVRARAERATEGPWICEEDELRIHSPRSYRYVARGGTDYPDATQRREQDIADLQFAAHARQDVPNLCDTIDRLTAERDRATAEVARLREALEAFVDDDYEYMTTAEIEPILARARAALGATGGQDGS